MELRLMWRWQTLKKDFQGDFRDRARLRVVVASQVNRGEQRSAGRFSELGKEKRKKSD